MKKPGRYYTGSIKNGGEAEEGSSGRKEKYLVMWPTIPAAEGGSSDTRVVDVIRELVELDFEVDFIFWKDLEGSMGKAALFDLGVNRILGPYENSKISRHPPSDLNGYTTIFLWSWTNSKFMNWILDTVRYLKDINGAVKVVSCTDETGMALSRLSKGFPGSDKDVLRNWILENRPVQILGKDVSDLPSAMQTTSLEVNDPTVKELVILETLVYIISTALVGANEGVLEMLNLMIPAKPAMRLSSIIPTTRRPSRSWTFSERKDILFIGHKSDANDNGVIWFLREVLSKVQAGSMLHIVGSVGVPDEFCKCYKFGCVSQDSTRVQCHGSLPTKELVDLTSSVKAVINPGLEPTGVAKEICRAMALGTPVVTTSYDGTFGSTLGVNEGVIQCPPLDAACFAKALNNYISNENEWEVSSRKAPLFLETHFSAQTFKKELGEIIRVVESDKVRVLVSGDARKNEESMMAQNWHIADSLNKKDGFEVLVKGVLDPPIDGVKGFLADSAGVVPLPTGFQFNAIIRQSWPPELAPPSLQNCYTGCRVAQYLPWEFGSLPREWMSALVKNNDEVWGPSEANTRVFVNSGIPPSKVRTVPCGVDCRELNLVASKSPASALNDGVEDDVVFIFSGGLIPRKGVDILLEEWNSLFCAIDKPSSLRVKLILHTSYELGYGNQEVKEMEEMVRKCNNIEWKRKEWLEREEYIDLLRGADVYVAPFRSEGFGVPVVEAMALGLRVIASTGGTSADDYLNDQNGYPVRVTSAVCRHYPCSGGSDLCVFPPCSNGKCACKHLVESPMWFKVERVELRQKLRDALIDVLASREWKQKQNQLPQSNYTWSKPTQAQNDVLDKYCWDAASEEYANGIKAMIARL
ncbi:hypothetical protein TL16_g00086 [Triparma laevis f. inornata]|uniref:Glycosyl transferase family 1 domain-containing protein n=1 Tax=Triparma laevis f. inornata TaxID=1714386 RepID=A0A9W6ZAG4_9STRA|nr:hypothetical protein TL16_g00086 [Triparma laevis f. inornata]